MLASPPLLLPGESFDHYHDLRQAIFLDLAPRCAIEWLLAIDVAELSWEIQRHRALRHKLLETYRQKAIEAALRRIDMVWIDPDFEDQAEYYTLQNALSWRIDPIAASESDARLSLWLRSKRHQHRNLRPGARNLGPLRRPQCRANQTDVAPSRDQKPTLRRWTSALAALKNKIELPSASFAIWVFAQDSFNEIAEGRKRIAKGFSRAQVIRLSLQIAPPWRGNSEFEAITTISSRMRRPTSSCLDLKPLEVRPSCVSPVLRDNGHQRTLAPYRPDASCRTSAHYDSRLAPRRSAKSALSQRGALQHPHGRAYVSSGRNIATKGRDDRDREHHSTRPAALERHLMPRAE